MKRKIYIARQVIEAIEKMTMEDTKIENGGLFFGRMNPGWVKIYIASDAGVNAIRSPSGITFDEKYLLQYAEKMEKEDLFVVGTWHSHPEFSSSNPSSKDIYTMKWFSKIYDQNHFPVFCISRSEKEHINVDFWGINNQLNVTHLTVEIMEVM
jgi:proteasome lid subunit RPN8/RPN11